ncbi:MAG: TRAP transporter small permease [Variovorax sp.]
MRLGTHARAFAGWLERHAEEAIAGACMCVLSTLMFAQVVMRYIFRSPMSWSDEIATYCMVTLVYFGAAYAVRERAHIRVLAAFWLLPRPAAVAVTVFADLLWFAFNTVMVWQGALFVHSFVDQPFYSAALEINLLWPHLAIPVGYALMCLRMAQAYWRWRRTGVAPFAAQAE